MKNQLLIIGITVLLVVVGLSGCFEETKQNNSTNLEDTVGPTTPASVRCLSPMKDTTPRFSWNASTDASGVAGYYVKIDTSGDFWVGNILTWNSTKILADGSHVFYVKAKDASSNGNNGSYGSCFFIINTTTLINTTSGGKPPVAVTNGPYDSFINQSIIFDGSKSYDTDGVIVNYSWNLGDGTILYGIVVGHSYSKAEVYSVSLSVIDNNSISDINLTIATIRLHSNNYGEKPLVADAGGPYVWYINNSITFDGLQSYDRDGHIVNYMWDLGDGTVLYGIVVGHSYSNPGVYNVALTVIDNNSLSDTNTTIATVQLYSNNSSTEQQRFLGSWYNEANGNEHWIFYSNWTQKYSILLTDNMTGEPYTTELWFNYTVNASMLCQIPFIDYSGVPWCYGYEFSNNDHVMRLLNYGAVMVVLIKD